MSNASQMVPGSWREIRLPNQKEVETDLLDTIVKSKNNLSLSEFGATTFILIREIQTKLPEILKKKQVF